MSDQQVLLHDRLQTLYSISKKLSVFASVEKSFAEILNYATASFPLLTAVLIEHWESEPKTSTWSSVEATPDMISAATFHAREVYSYFAGSTMDQKASLMKEFPSAKVLVRGEKTLIVGNNNKNNYIVMPLGIDDLPALGSLHLEGTRPLSEADLDFAITLSNLISVALDRYYKTKWTNEKLKSEADRYQVSIAASREKIKELEIERGLREAFVSLLTHDLKSPMMIISISSEILHRKKDSPSDVVSFANRIEKQAKRVTQMINNLLDANRIRGGEKLTVKRQNTNMNALVESTVSELSFIYGDRFLMELDKDISAFCDPEAFRRIIENLCNNAIKYGYEDTPIIVALGESEHEIYVSVNNQGEILSVEDQITLFDQFRRTQKAQKSNNQGWGIGLALVKGVAEAHNGSVEVSSLPNTGTTFSVRIPKTSN